MSGSFAQTDVERFRAIIARQIGLHFDDSKLESLDGVLQRRLEKLRRSSSQYLHDLEAEPANGELGFLAQELTVTETYFFRNIEQFRVFRNVALPDRMRDRGASRTLRLLSAACASGEEPYTIAILAHDVVGDAGWDVTIRAVDINPVALDKARRARFAAWSLRDTPSDVQRKWFHVTEGSMVLADMIRGAVAFESRNLAVEDFDLWQPDSYDVIFCRNVMMYFVPEQAHALAARIARALVPGGYLFLGHAETLRGISDDFHLRHSHDTFYYQRKNTLRPARATARAAECSPPAGRSAFPSVALSDAWVDAIQDAGKRIEALVMRSDASPGHVLPSAPSWDLTETLDLVRSERFGEALEHVRGLPAEANRDPDVLLLEAMMLTHAGTFSTAEDVCQRLLSISELDPGAHYVLALCREGLGDIAGALEQDRAAIYLDPSFAMPRLHAGLLARRIGERDLARRELSQALSLLKHEDASRLLLFGGGFTRQALTALCSSALNDCGEQQ